MKRMLWFLMSLFVAGCATSALTVEDAKQYAGLDIHQFLEQRFRDNQSKRVEGGIRYKAYFNDVNYAQLKRPTTELINFCKAQGGNPERTKAYAGNPFGRYYVPPVAAGIQAGTGALARGATAGVASAVIQDGIEAAQRQNEEVDQRSLGYRVSKELYGEWTCQGIARPWTTSVIPVEFIPRRPDGSLTVDVMMIEIRPW